MGKNTSGEFTIDVVLFEEDGITAEIDFFVNEGNLQDSSDWDSQNYLEIYEYRVYSGGCEISLDLDDGYLYDVLRKELRKKQLEIDCS